MDLLLKESELLGEEKGLSKHLYPRYAKEEVEKVEEFTFFRTILFVGLSGAGKTSSINFLINTFLGVRFEDNFRFLLINEKTVSGT
jgi:putative ribosome biogenesis GTPase RsgA